MKLRRLELKLFPVPGVPNLTFTYDTILREVLTAPIQTGQGAVGLTSDELATSVACLLKLREAKEKEQPDVKLTDEEYKFLLNRLNLFRWSFNLSDVVPLALDLVKYVRELKEEDFDVTPATKPKQ
jgi:hypothetical protein